MGIINECNWNAIGFQIVKTFILFGLNAPGVPEKDVGALEGPTHCEEERGGFETESESVYD
jgi:hypothetical protein